MKKENVDKIDEELKKENVHVSSGIIIVITISLFMFLPFFPISSSTIEGTAYKYSAKVTETGNLPIMWVKINNNQIVRASLPTKLKFEKGARVEVVEKKTIIGANTYQVTRYIE